jgi:hypothetical protein
MKCGASRIVGKLEEDPKCSGIVWMEVVKLITHGPVVYEFWVIRFSLFYFPVPSIYRQ